MRPNLGLSNGREVSEFNDAHAGAFKKRLGMTITSGREQGGERVSRVA